MKRKIFEYSRRVCYFLSRKWGEFLCFCRQKMLFLALICPLFTVTLVNIYYPKPKVFSDARANRLVMSYEFEQRYKETLVEQGYLKEAIQYIQDNHIDNIETTWNIVPFLTDRNVYFVSNKEIDFFPKTLKEYPKTIQYKLLPTNGNFCKTPPYWNCDWKESGEVVFENKYFRLIKGFIS